MKHISFGESEVMRSLERLAIKNKTFGEDSIEQIIKSASIKPSAPVASNDLHNDIISLASALRKKGFKKEANELEDKAFMHKQAETHLYRAIDEDAEDVINFAHPDGDIKVSDAQDKNGEVETTLSAHEKILNVVNKQPNGKYAKVVDNLILATSEILNVDLMKLAQAKSVAKPIDDTEDSELSQEDWEQNTPPEKKKQIEEAKKLVLTAKDELSDQITSAINIVGLGEGAEWLTFSPLTMDQNSFKYYSRKSGVNLESIIKYIGEYKMFFGDSAMSIEAVVNKITATNDYNKLLGFINEVAPSVKNWFTGTNYNYTFTEDAQAKINAKQPNDSRYVLNKNSVWTSEIDRDLNITNITFNQNVRGAANQIAQLMIAEYNKLFGPELIAKAVAGVKKDLEPIKKALIVSQKSINSILPDSIRRTVGIVIGQLQSFNNSIRLTNEKIIDFQSVYNSLGSPEASSVPTKITDILNKILLQSDDYIAKLGDMKINPKLDQPINIRELKPIISSYATIANILRTYLRSHKDAPQDIKINYQLANQIYLLLKQSEVTPLASIIANITNIFPEINSLETLKEYADQGLQLVEQYKSQAADDGLISSAAWAGAGTVKAKPAGAISAVPSSGAVVQQPGLRKFDPTNEDQLAVAKMQLALNNLGRGVSKTNPNDGLAIIGTGPKSNPHLNMFDGIWGSNTAAALALALAKKYAPEIGTTASQWNSSIKGHNPGTKELADANTNAINKVNAELGTLTEGTQRGADKIYDKLPSAIADNTLDIMTGKIPLVANNLSSLGALYYFLDISGITVNPARGESKFEGVGTELTPQPEQNAQEATPSAPSRRMPKAPNTRASFIAAIEKIAQQGIPLQHRIDDALNAPIKPSKPQAQPSAEGEGYSYNQWKYILNWLKTRAQNQYRAATDEQTKQIKQEYYDAVRALQARLQAIVQKLKITDPNQIISSDKLGGGGLGSDRGGRGGRGRSDGDYGDLEGHRTRRGRGQDSSPPIGDLINLRSGWFDSSDESSELPSQFLRLQDFVRLSGASNAQRLFGNDTVKYQKFLRWLSEQLKTAFANWEDKVGPSAEESSEVQDYYNRWNSGIARQFRDITSVRR